MGVAKRKETVIRIYHIRKNIFIIKGITKRITDRIFYLSFAEYSITLKPSFSMNNM